MKRRVQGDAALQHGSFRGKIYCDDDPTVTNCQRDVLDRVAAAFNRPGVVLLCDPSIVGARSGPPDIALVDPRSGVHAIEVKGVTIDQVLGTLPGGALRLQYGTRIREVDPRKQASAAMFAIKDAAHRHFNFAHDHVGGELSTPFAWWVMLPRISRQAWIGKFGDGLTREAGVLFQDDLMRQETLGRMMSAPGARRLARCGIEVCPDLQLRSVMAAFGDSASIAPPDPSPRPQIEGSRGEQLDEDLAAYRVLSEEQRKLAKEPWTVGPRLVRGVAGSGKTAVLATQVARTLEQVLRPEEETSLYAHLPARDGQLQGQLFCPPILVVCFNRTLVPMLARMIQNAFQQRTGEEIPEGRLVVTSFNELMYRLSGDGLFAYQRVERHPDNAEERAAFYLAALGDATARDPDHLSRGLFHSVFIDEGQDFLEDEFRILIRLCAKNDGQAPRLFIFYDDAQNLYGRRRPVWSDLGIEVRGRAHVMDACYRSPRRIVEPAFNVLVGTWAEPPGDVQTRGFADLVTLRQKGLIDEAQSQIHLKFCTREGEPPLIHRLTNESDEDRCVAQRCRELIVQDALLPHEIAVIAYTRQRAEQIGRAVARALQGITSGGQPVAVRHPFVPEEKDALAVKEGSIAVSTVHSIKGYDAAYVIVTGAGSFPATAEGRASFYVACTRARDWLEVTSANDGPLFAEFRRASVTTD